MREIRREWSLLEDGGKTPTHRAGQPRRPFRLFCESSIGLKAFLHHLPSVLVHLPQTCDVLVPEPILHIATAEAHLQGQLDGEGSCVQQLNLKLFRRHAERFRQGMNCLCFTRTRLDHRLQEQMTQLAGGYLSAHWNRHGWLLSVAQWRAASYATGPGVPPLPYPALAMLQYLQRGEVLEIILSAEVIFTAVFTLALFIVVHAVLTFLRQSGDLYTRLAQIDADLSVLHASIPGKLERITQRRRELEPLQADFRLIQAYYARLQHLERKSIEAEMEAVKEEESDKDNRIQRQRLGLDRFI